MTRQSIRAILSALAVLTGLPAQFPMKEFLLFSALIYGSLFLGWVLQKRVPALAKRDRLVSRITLMTIETPLILVVFWGINRTLFRTYFPVVISASIILAVMGLAGYAIARAAGWGRKSQGAFVVSSMFSNTGSTLGGFLCLLYLGDQGLVVSQLFILLSIPFYFTAVFSVARRFAGGEKISVWQATRANFTDPLAALPLVAVVIGLGLGLAGPGLPPVLELPRRILVYAAVIMYSLSFGLNAHFRPMFRRIREYLAILPVKFVVGPLTGLAVASLLGYSLTEDPLAFKVIIIQSATPVAIWSVVACKLFRLDEQLALGLWIFTTLCMAALVPAVSWLSGL